MGTIDQALAIAAGEEGYIESGGRGGHSGNVTKYWAELAAGFQGQPWCAAFVQWVLLKAGVQLVSRSFFVPSIEADYKRAGRLFSVAQAQPGDQLIYSIGDGHTGLLVSIDTKARTVTAIEGNTSSGSFGSQDNGGGVYLRTRPWSLVKSVGRPPYSTPKEVKPMHDPAWVFRPVVADCAWPGGGALLLADNGDVYAVGNAPYYGDPSGESYWGDRKPATIEVITDPAELTKLGFTGPGYRVTATNGNTYEYGPRQ